MNNDTLRITLLQTDLVWEDKAANLNRIEANVRALGGTTDLVVLPEMCTTGFSMQSLHLAEPMEGDTVARMLLLAEECQLAVAGTFICREGDAFYNRAFLITPEGACFHSDKRHLFRMGQENHFFSPGSTRPVFRYRGWNILLLVCYDLRFPVWSRNHACEYDLVLYMANWPASRIQVWDTLLAARALENQTYVCGVNRVGKDGEGIRYNGHSQLLSPKGEPLAFLSTPEGCAETRVIDKSSLNTFREKFPVWKDAD